MTYEVDGWVQSQARTPHFFLFITYYDILVPIQPPGTGTEENTDQIKCTGMAESEDSNSHVLSACSLYVNIYKCKCV
jgi:hypothetical protein